MAEFAADMCLRFLQEGLPFSLEHPGRSIARKLDKWIELQTSPGVSCTEHHHCMFEPCEKRKFQVLINNIEGFDEEIGLLCQSAAVCSRTHRAHASFTHNVQNGKVTNFGTEGTSEYPAGLTRIQAKLTIAAVWKRKLYKKYSFIEMHVLLRLQEKPSTRLISRQLKRVFFRQCQCRRFITVRQ